MFLIIPFLNSSFFNVFKIIAKSKCYKQEFV